MDLSISTCCTK